MKFENVLMEKAREDGIEKIVVGGVIINDENKCLILRRKTNDFMGDIDEIPSGKLEKNEGIFDALRREVKEESNLDVDQIVRYIDYFDYLSGSGKKSRQYNFVVKVNSYKNIRLTEHDKFQWQTLDEINSNNRITSKTLFTLNIAFFNKI